MTLKVIQQHTKRLQPYLTCTIKANFGMESAFIILVAIQLQNQMHIVTSGCHKSLMISLWMNKEVHILTFSISFQNINIIVSIRIT